MNGVYFKATCNCTVLFKQYFVAAFYASFKRMKIRLLVNNAVLICNSNFYSIKTIIDLTF